MTVTFLILKATKDRTLLDTAYVQDLCCKFTYTLVHLLTQPDIRFEQSARSFLNKHKPNKTLSIRCRTCNDILYVVQVKVN